MLDIYLVLSADWEVLWMNYKNFKTYDQFIEILEKGHIDSKYDFLNQSVPTNKIFFALSVLTEILKESSIKKEFQALLVKYPTIPKESMGIPQSWETLTPWSKL